MSKVVAPPAGSASRGWQWVQWAAAAVLALEVLNQVSFVAETERANRLAAILIGTGLVLFVGLFTYGVWQRSRWGAWIGGVVGSLQVVFGTIPLLIYLQGGRVEINETAIHYTPVSAVLAGLKIIAYLGVLVGLGVIWWERRARDRDR